MKSKNLLMALLPIMVILPQFEAKAGPDTLSMSPGYVNDVFYSMENGTVQTIVREVWDLAFSTKVFSASILINDGAGSELYTWGNGDTSGWNAVDTIGMGSWPVLYNDPDEWENGAFNRLAKGHPDYGWGAYNAITHDVVGDSLYILKRADGAIFKIWVKVKTYVGAAPVWIFRYALLDGTMQQEISLNCTNYSNKNFIYFSLSAGLPIDREPASSDWDILFTKYMAIHPTGSPYIVTGVLSNYNIGANKFTGVPRSFSNWATTPLDYSRAVIGYDWKTFNMSTFTYIVDDSTVFFVQDQVGDLHKLYFTAFAGSTTGKIMLFKDRVSIANVDAFDPHLLSASLFPNPANLYTNVSINVEIGQDVDIKLFDLNGKQLRSYSLSPETDKMIHPVSLDGLANGLYFVGIQTRDQFLSLKLIVNR